MYDIYLRDFNLNIILLEVEYQSSIISLKMLTKLLNFYRKKGNGKSKYWDIFCYPES